MFIPIEILVALVFVFLLIITLIQGNDKKKLKRLSIIESAKPYFKIYHNYIKRDYYKDMDGFEEFLINASNDKLKKSFEPIIKKEVEYSIKQFKEFGTIDSLCTLSIFKKEIKDNWSKYDHISITFSCFLKDWYTLSILPISEEIYVDTEENIFLSTHFAYGIDINNRPQHESDPLNEHKTISISNDDIPPFITLHATLTANEQGELILANCYSEYSNYYNHLKKIHFLI